MPKCLENSIRLIRETYPDGSFGMHYGVYVEDAFYPIRLEEPFRPSFQPLHRFRTGGSGRLFTEHRIIIDKDHEALLEVCELGYITRISYVGKDLDYFDVPFTHEFMTFAVCEQPARNLFKNEAVD